MAKKKKPVPEQEQESEEQQMPKTQENPPDQHKARKAFRVDDTLHSLLKQLAEENNRPMSREFRAAIINHLKAHGKWPPPKRE